jgi:hypothetical protein
LCCRVAVNRGGDAQQPKRGSRKPQAIHSAPERPTGLTLNNMRPQDLGIGRLFQRIRDAAIVAEAKTQQIVLTPRQVTSLTSIRTGRLSCRPLGRMVVKSTSRCRSVLSGRWTIPMVMSTSYSLSSATSPTASRRRGQAAYRGPRKTSCGAHRAIGGCPLKVGGEGVRA